MRKLGIFFKYGLILIEIDMHINLSILINCYKCNVLQPYDVILCPRTMIRACYRLLRK